MIRLHRGLVSSLRKALFKALGVVVIAVMLGSTAVKAQGNPAESPDELNRQIRELYSSGKYDQAIPSGASSIRPLAMRTPRSLS